MERNDKNQGSDRENSEIPNTVQHLHKYVDSI
jgi:hypothetical protein